MIGLVALGTGLLVCQQGAPYKVGSGVSAPRVLQKSDPAYTKEASDAKIQGPVLLTLVVGSDGVARDIKVKQSLDPGLDNNAIAAVQQWKFQPGTKDGQAVDVMATIEVNFRLK
jgi:TonB family protein